MTENEKTIRAFCEQFSPPLKFVKTERINNVPMPDAWQTSYWDAARSVGMTVVAYSGGIHAFIEAAGKGDIAPSVGKVFAKALGLFHGSSVPCEECKHTNVHLSTCSKAETPMKCGGDDGSA